MKRRDNFVFAIKVGKKSEEVEFKNYCGIGAFKVVAINPTAKELKAMGRNVEEDPQYVTVGDDGTKNVNIRVYLQTDPKAKVNNGINMSVILMFNVSNAIRKGNKIQLVDKYGDFAWGTEDEVKNKQMPTYPNGPAKIDKDYREAYVGEENLIKFIKTWVNTPNTNVYKDGQFVYQPNEECECSIDMDKLFKGDFSELKELAHDCSEFLFKAAVGIRTDDQGRIRMHVFNRGFLKNGASKFDSLEKEIRDSQANGVNANVEYFFNPLEEYVVKDTNFEDNTTENSDDDDLPFSDSNSSNSPWD